MASTKQNQRDDGGDETDGIDEPTSPVHPIAAYPPVLEASSNTTISWPVKRAAGGRAPEFYGFVAWLATLLVYFAYILWTILPDDLIRAVGIKWYPAREWSILLPAWSVMLFLTAYFIYIALGIYGTPALDSMNTITDPRAHFPALETLGDGAVERNPYFKFADPGTVPAPYDIPPGIVNRVLYGKRRRSEALSER